MSTQTIYSKSVFLVENCNIKKYVINLKMNVIEVK